jgi:release factor glutamine methyltransferase
VNRHVLIPRPETELVVDAVLAASLPPGASVADLGTGSGCIALAIAKARPDLSVQALDSSPQALGVARDNAERLDLAVRFEHGDLANPPEEWSGRMDVVVSNPPYVSEEEWRTLEPEVRDYEPKGALVPGPTGNEAYEALAPAAFRLLRPGGTLVLELGHTSEAAATRAVNHAGFGETGVLPDLRGIPRILVARRPR